ncbi:hypothetical protein L596_002292 [Steinernema carpocapsae]|uniref:Uncharacterized protein n=1 Tax=Steinernema carpocapsae TaxID=34508 RepID=A0A4U8URH1_STECR|nr:hypothetical protein L596_002292 [Steinernema carpocapsae]
MNVSAILSTSGADSAQIDIVEKLQRMLEGIKGLNPALAGTPSPPVTLESNISPKPTTPKAVPPPKPGSLDAAVLRRRAALARDSARNLESCISRLPLPSTSTATTTTTSVAKSSSKTPVTTTTSSSPAATARDDSAPTTSASVDRQPRNSSGSHQRRRESDGCVSACPGEDNVVADRRLCAALSSEVRPSGDADYGACFVCRIAKRLSWDWEGSEGGVGGSLDSNKLVPKRRFFLLTEVVFLLTCPSTNSGVNLLIIQSLAYLLLIISFICGSEGACGNVWDAIVRFRDGIAINRESDGELFPCRQSQAEVLTKTSRETLPNDVNGEFFGSISQMHFRASGEARFWCLIF